MLSFVHQLVADYVCLCFGNSMVGLSELLCLKQQSDASGNRLNESGKMKTIGYKMLKCPVELRGTKGDNSHKGYNY